MQWCHHARMPRNPSKIDYSRGSPNSIIAFENLIDPRHPTGNLRHHFGEVVFMAFTAIICGVNSYELMEEFCSLRSEWFKKWLKLPNGIPSFNTFSRIFQAIEPNAFAQCIVSHLQNIGYQGIHHHVAIDGKALRGSRDQDNKHVHSVSAWACDERITQGVPPAIDCQCEKKSCFLDPVPNCLSEGPVLRRCGW